MIGVINGSTVTKENNVLISLIKIAGITILERQIRIMRRLGIKKIVVIARKDKGLIENEIERLKFHSLKIQTATFNSDDEVESLALKSKEKLFLYFDGCSIFDERVPERFYESDHEMAAFLPEATLLESQKNRGVTVVTKENKKYVFVGIATLSFEKLKSINSEECQDLSLALMNRLVKEESSILDISLLSTYNYDLRRDQSYLWHYIESEKDNPKAKKELLNQAQKSVLDWPAYFIHRPIEKWIVYHICEWPITPNQITLINIAVALIGTCFFATGHLFWAMLFAVATGIIDGLDGKQARVKVMMSKIGKLEEVSDRIYEYSWYLAIAYLLSSQGFGKSPYLCFWLLFFFHATDISLSALFKFKRSVQLDDFGAIERNFRWIGSRRNTNIWSLIPFVICGALYQGYIFITVYYGLTVAFKFWRVVVHLSQKNSLRKTF